MKFCFVRWTCLGMLVASDYLIEAGILDEDNNHYDSLIPTKFVPSEYTRVKKSGHNLLLTFVHNIHAALKKLCLSCIEGCSWIHHKTRYRLDHAINTRKERLFPRKIISVFINFDIDSLSLSLSFQPPRYFGNKYTLHVSLSPSQENNNVFQSFVPTYVYDQQRHN